MRNRLIAVAAMVLTVALTRMDGITYGTVDTQNIYANTGAFIVRSPATGRVFPLCSGTLIAPTVFLTASHCTVYFENVLAPLNYTAFVSFDVLIPFGALTSPATNLIPVTGVVTNPEYNQRQSDSGDIAVLLLAAGSTIGITPAALPTLNQLDALAAKNGLKKKVFTAAGYGVQNRVVGGGVPYFQDLNPIPRMWSNPSFEALSPGYLRLSQNPATGDGGTCYGDSGGPNFLEVDGSLILMAITITGDSVCRATNVDYRLDTASARAFLAPHVTLP
ncbi:MAG: trypsin-like serine protease [Acidobacteria bacterium]|nr:trypsin-like serine protease [Acidobacteriota bacterium]